MWIGRESDRRFDLIISAISFENFAKVLYLSPNFLSQKSIKIIFQIMSNKIMNKAGKANANRRQQHAPYRRRRSTPTTPPPLAFKRQSLLDNSNPVWIDNRNQQLIAPAALVWTPQPRLDVCNAANPTTTTSRWKPSLDSPPRPQFVQPTAPFNFPPQFSCPWLPAVASSIYSQPQCLYVAQSSAPCSFPVPLIQAPRVYQQAQPPSASYPMIDVESIPLPPTLYQPIRRGSLLPKPKQLASDEVGGR